LAVAAPGFFSLSTAAQMRPGETHMDKYRIIGPQDEATRLEQAITKVANFDGTTLDLGNGYRAGGIGVLTAAIVQVTAAYRGSSDETYTFQMQESADGATWQACGPEVSIDVSGTSATIASYSVGGIVSFEFVRLSLTVAGTTPTISYQAWLVPAHSN
jgi:hypothetical protein